MMIMARAGGGCPKIMGGITPKHGNNAIGRYFGFVFWTKDQRASARFLSFPYLQVLNKSKTNSPALFSGQYLSCDRLITLSYSGC